MLRIIAGEYRSRRLLSPQGDETTRPYLNRVRESIFNILREWCEEARVLDLFAGVGTMGLEAASRGAAEVLMVEENQRIHALLQQNIDALGCGDRVTALQADALGATCLRRAPRPVDLVFVDPPYAMLTAESSRARILRQMAQCASIMSPGGWLVLRGPLGPDDMDLEVPGFNGPEPHRYGPTMWVLLYERHRDERVAPGGE